MTRLQKNAAVRRKSFTARLGLMNVLPLLRFFSHFNADEDLTLDINTNEV